MLSHDSRLTFIEKAQIHSLYSTPAFHSNVVLRFSRATSMSLFSLCIGDRIRWFRTCRMECTFRDVARVSNSARFRSRRPLNVARGSILAHSIAPIGTRIARKHAIADRLAPI